MSETISHDRPPITNAANGYRRSVPSGTYRLGNSAEQGRDDSAERQAGFGRDRASRSRASAGEDRAGGTVTPAPWRGARTASHEERGNDLYETPACAVHALLRTGELVGKGPIWEPAAGTGNISRVLWEAGFEVKASDLLDHPGRDRCGSNPESISSRRRVRRSAARSSPTRRTGWPTISSATDFDSAAPSSRCNRSRSSKASAAATSSAICAASGPASSASP